jgi:dihydroorotate dehydrogenase (NAD+) catalytic subunit
VSGPALLPVGLLAVRRVRDRLPSIPILGVGGIRTAADVRDYLRAGATLVQVGTAALADPRAPARILAGLERADG